jgi:hypothetical protein
LNKKILILLFITGLTSCFLYFYQKGIHQNTIVVQSLGYTSLGWEIIRGRHLVEKDLEKLDFRKDSISYCEIALTGKDIDPESLYFPYDCFEIEYKIDTIVHNINCEKPYSPKLEVINWWWQNKYLELGLSALVIILLFTIGVSIMILIYHKLKKVFNR